MIYYGSGSGSKSGTGARQYLTKISTKSCLVNVGSCVVDLDPYVFGPPGSGSVIICTDPKPVPSIINQNSIKTLVSTVAGPQH
jgi:hypothetical protein